VSPSFRDRLEVPRRRWRVATTVFALVFGAAVASALLLPKRYLSGTLILVERDSVPESVVPKVTAEDRNRQLLTLRQQLLSRTRLETILRELDPYPQHLRTRPLSFVVDEMRAAIHLTVKGNDAFTVEYQHRKPEMAMRVVDRLTRLFIEDTGRAREEQASAAQQFLDTELQRTRAELEVKERALRDYKEKHIGVLPEQMATNLATLQRLQQERQTVSTALQAALDRESALELSRGRAAPADDPDAQLAALEADLAALRARYTEEHPDVRAARLRVEEMRRRVAASRPGRAAEEVAGAGELAQARGEVARLEERGRAIEGRIAQMQGQVEQAPRVDQDLGTLTRDLDKLNESYASLMSKKMDAQMARKLEQRWKGERFRVLDPAYLPDRPSFPNLLLFTLAGLIAGLAAGIGAAFVFEDLDRTVKRKEDLVGVLPFPVIGVIGRIEPPPAAVERTVPESHAL